jgi:DNA-binding NarL/FixJ family response regulator
MRILVVDDQVLVVMGLRGVLKEHTVSDARDPGLVPRALADKGPFDQAIVDLRFSQSASTGLNALATLREKSPATKTIVTTTDDEENRLLYLLAAFQFYQPEALLPKRTGDRGTRAIVDAVGRGETAPNADADPYRAAARLRPPLLDQVVHSQTELSIWRELARFDKRGQIANAAHVSVGRLDEFTAAKTRVIDDVIARFPWLDRAPQTLGAAGGPAASYPSGVATAHGANLVEVIHFARTHVQFFADQEVARLLGQHWRSR